MLCSANQPTLIHLQVIPGLLTWLVRFIQQYYFIQILATSVFVIVTSLSRPVVPNLFCLKGHLFFYYIFLKFFRRSRATFWDLEGLEGYFWPAGHRLGTTGLPITYTQLHTLAAYRTGPGRVKKLESMLQSKNHKNRKLTILKQSPFFDFTIKIFHFFTEYTRWTYPLVSSL